MTVYESKFVTSAGCGKWEMGTLEEGIEACMISSTVRSIFPGLTERIHHRGYHEFPSSYNNISEHTVKYLPTWKLL